MTMDCQQCSDDLTAYIDGELDESAARQLKNHLETCDPCRAEYEELRDSATFVSEHAAELEPVPEIWNNLRSRIAELPAPAGSSGVSRLLVMNRWAAMLATVAAMVVLALGLWGFERYEQSRSELESYMNEYIQMRTAQERQYELQMIQERANALQNEPGAEQTTDNPFADMRPVALTNPFHVEAR